MAIVDLQPKSPMPAHQPGFQASGIFSSLRSYFCVLGSDTESLQMRSGPTIKNKSHVRKEFASHFLIFWRRWDRALDFLGNSPRALVGLGSWCQISLWVMSLCSPWGLPLFQMLWVFIATSCACKALLFSSLLFKQTPGFTCHSLSSGIKKKGHLAPGLRALVCFVT
jgi:hypothetical protein